MFEYLYTQKTTQHPTVVCKAVLDRLRALGCKIPGPDEDWRISRTYAGTIQRSTGAWSWFLYLVNHDGAPYEKTKYNGMIGGYYPARLCAQEGATLTELDSHHNTQTLDPPEQTMRNYGKGKS